MFVLVEATSGGELQLQAVGSKQQLPLEELAVVAGRAQEPPSRQVTCVSARVKALGRRAVLVLPVPVAATLESLAGVGVAVQVLDVGEAAAEFAHDVRSCFPTLVRRSPLASEDSDDESDDDDDDERRANANVKAAAGERKRQEAEAAKLRLAAMQREAGEYMRRTRVKLLRSADELPLAFLIHDPTQVCAALLREEAREQEAAEAGGAPVRCQWLCVDLPALSPPASGGDSANTSLPHNFALLFSHAAPSPRSEQFLSIPVPRTPLGYFASTVSIESSAGEDAEIFCDATVLSLGAKREATVHGGGKTPAETLSNIRMRHASGTFCTLVEPATTWGAVATKHAALVPAMRGELRARRVLGPTANVPLELLLAHETQR